MGEMGKSMTLVYKKLNFDELKRIERKAHKKGLLIGYTLSHKDSDSYRAPFMSETSLEKAVDNWGESGNYKG